MKPLRMQRAPSQYLPWSPVADNLSELLMGMEFPR
jgi:hypothetical protein